MRLDDGERIPADGEWCEAVAELDRVLVVVQPGELDPDTLNQAIWSGYVFGAAVPVHAQR